MSHYNAKRLAKNTLALYARTFVTLLISLYTSRIVLNTLGVEDFGVYNVVGGVVMLFVFLNSAMASGTQRFLNYEMGMGDLSRVNTVFSTSLKIHFVIAIIIFLLAETVGLWFVNYKLVLPEDRMTAVNWVYQFAVLSTMISLLQVPYLATVIANEKMQIYAYVGLLEAVLKLVIVYLLLTLDYDKLIVYAVLLFLVQAVITLVYVYYCLLNFEECKYRVPKDKKLFKEMVNFSSWNLLASIATVSKGQGLNIVLNLFFGPVVNAARAVAMSISSMTGQFISSFMTAVNPQIIKSYSSGNIDSLVDLIFKSSKFAFFFLSLISLPILINTQFILDLWLKAPPDLSAIFVQLVLIDALVISVSYPLTTGAQATGNVRIFHLAVTFFELLNLPISYLLLNERYAAETVFIVTICMSLTALIARLIILRTLIQLPIKKFVINVLLRGWSVFAISYFIMVNVNSLFMIQNSVFIFSSLLSVFLLSALILLIGLDNNEKKFILNKIRSLRDGY